MPEKSAAFGLERLFACPFAGTAHQIGLVFGLEARERERDRFARLAVAQRREQLGECVGVEPPRDRGCALDIVRQHDHEAEIGDFVVEPHGAIAAARHEREISRSGSSSRRRPAATGRDGTARPW